MNASHLGTQGIAHLFTNLNVAFVLMNPSGFNRQGLHLTIEKQKDRVYEKKIIIEIIVRATGR